MSKLIPFEFESNQVRILMDDNGDPLFVGKDVCDALGYANHNKSLGDHCKGVTACHLSVSANQQEHALGPA